MLNVRASYFDEAEEQVRYLTAKGIKKIGILYQNDAYGLAVKGGAIKALGKRGMTLAGEGHFERNTMEIDAGLASLKKENPEAVIMVGTYKAMAAFIKKAKAEGFNPVFLNVSFVGTAALVKELGGAGDGVIITQVMPSPADGSVPLVKQYRADMQAAGHRELDYTDLEGYVDAMVFVEILTKAGANPTRDSFLAAAEGLNLNKGGMHFMFTENEPPGTGERLPDEDLRQQGRAERKQIEEAILWSRSIFKTNSVATKFLASSLVFIIALVLAMAVISIRTNNAMMLEQMDARGNAMVRYIAKTSIFYYHNFDLGALDGFVKEITALRAWRVKIYEGFLKEDYDDHVHAYPFAIAISIGIACLLRTVS